MLIQLQNSKTEDIAMHEKYAVQNNVFLTGAASKVLPKIIAELQENVLIEVCTNGKFSFHELISQCLSYTGKADLFLTTWAIKETPVRMLFKLKESGLLKTISALMDHRTKTLDAKHFPFLEKLCNKIKLTNIHAKVAVLQGENHSLVILTSANLSSNNRIEFATINTHTQSINFHLSWIQTQLQS
jgi:hypothetical protein